MELETGRRSSSPSGLIITAAVLTGCLRPGQCLGLIYDELRDASEPLSTRDLAERIISRHAIKLDDERSRDLIQHTILSSLNRAGATLTRMQRGGTICWQLAQAA